MKDGYGCMNINGQEYVIKIYSAMVGHQQGNPYACVNLSGVCVLGESQEPENLAEFLSTTWSPEDAE